MDHGSPDRGDTAVTMLDFLHAHATHPDWRMALALVRAQLDAQQRRLWGEDGPSSATLGIAYFSDHYRVHAQALMEALSQQWPGVSWSGTVGVGVAANGVEYFDEPALAVMLTHIPDGRFKVFSGAKPLSGFEAWTALVHADPATPDLADLIAEMSDRTGSGYLFGGISASRGATWQLADGAFEGGLSGVAFSRDVKMLSRVTQGSQPVGPTRRITACDGHVVTELDGQPALRCLEQDLDIDLKQPRQAIPVLQSTLVGLSDEAQTDDGLQRQRRAFGHDVRVRHLLGVDPAGQAFAVADRLQCGMQLTLCQRNVEAARRDLVRICSEIREELAEDLLTEALPDPAKRIAGAIYVSCSGRGGPHFGGTSAELELIRHALGDVPLVGFFAAGEVGHHHLYGYTGVLTVFPR